MSLTLKKQGIIFRKFKLDLWGDFILRYKFNKLKVFLYLFFFKTFKFRRLVSLFNSLFYFNLFLINKGISNDLFNFLIESRMEMINSIFDQFKISKKEYFSSSRFQQNTRKRFTPFKRFLYNRQKFQLTYGGFSWTKLRRFFVKFKKVKKIRLLYFVNVFEYKLDVVLYRAKFVSTIKEARTLIKNGFVLVNNKVVTYPDYFLKFKDIVSIDSMIRKGILLKILLRLKSIRLRLDVMDHLLIDYKNLVVIPINVGIISNNTHSSLFISSFSRVLKSFKKF